MAKQESADVMEDVVSLHLVNSSREIQESVAAFNRGAIANYKLAEELLHQTTYWVLDPSTGCFGPSKFVGFRAMTFESYQRARRGHKTGDRFDGNVTRLRIEHVLDHEYAPDEGLADRLETWTTTFVAPDIFKGTKRGKWKFITLPQDATLSPDKISREQ